MKLTPEGVFHEDTPVTAKKAVIGKKEKRPKKERTFGRKQKEETKEDVSDEDGSEEVVTLNEASSEDGLTLDEIPPTVDQPDDGEDSNDVPRVKKPMKKRVIVGIVAAGVLGACLCAVGVRGLLSVKSMRGSDYQPSKAVSEEYQKVLETGEKDFEEANQKRLEEQSQNEADAQTEGTTGLTTEDPKEEIAVDAGAEERSKDEQIAALQSEINSLKQQVSDAQNQTATMEQELNNTKSQLSASESREAQLQSQLDATIAGSAK